MRNYLIILTIGLFSSFLSLSDDNKQGNSHNHKEKNHGAKHYKKAKKMFHHIDSNNDGKVSLEEHMAFAKKRFEKLDDNKDGFITKDEARKAHKNMRKKRGTKNKEQSK